MLIHLDFIECQKNVQVYAVVKASADRLENMGNIRSDPKVN